jgi:ketosteroid isomerase-like protein
MNVETDRQAVAEVLQQFAAAIHGKDAAALEALHAPGARIYDLAPPLGRGFSSASLIEWLSSWDKPVSQTWADQQIEIGGDLAVCSGYVRVDTARDGEDASWWVRRTVSLRRAGDTWRITHDHESVPFYMDGSDRPAMDLAPPDDEAAQTPTA